MYNEKVLDHNRNPRNVGEITNADGVGIYMNDFCGDITKFWIKVTDNRIMDVKYKTQGCAASIACGSVLTEMAKDKTVNETIEITKQDVLVALGGLPEPKIHCSMLAIDALKDAIYDYSVKNNKPVPQELIDKHEQLKPQIQELQKKGYILI
jgi:nitrogen fixation NifU-like protein